MVKKLEQITGLSYRKLIVLGVVFKLVSFILFPSLMSGCKSFDKISIGEIQEVKLNGIAGQTVYVEFKIPIENVSKLNVKINEVDLNVDINGKYVGKVTNIDKIKIFKKSNEVYTIKLKLKIAGLFGTLNTLKILKNDSAELSLKGSIGAKFMGIKKKLDINEKQTVDFSGYQKGIL